MDSSKPLLRHHRKVEKRTFDSPEAPQAGSLPGKEECQEEENHNGYLTKVMRRKGVQKREKFVQNSQGGKAWEPGDKYGLSKQRRLTVKEYEVIKKMSFSMRRTLLEAGEDLKKEMVAASRFNFSILSSSGP